MSAILAGIMSILVVLGIATLVIHTNTTLDRAFLSLHHTTIIKGIAILMVVISHIGDNSEFRVFSPLGAIGVAMFLICSGYGLHQSFMKKGLDGFFKRRLSKILTPYWIAVVFFYLLYPHEFTVLRSISNLLLLHTYEFWWFIQFLVMLYVMFYLVYRLVPERMRVTVIGILSAIFFLVVHNYLWSGQAFSFLIGIVLAQYSDKKIHLSKAWFISSLGLLLGLLSLALKQTDFIRQSNYLIFNTNQVILNVASAMGLIYLLYPILKIKMIQLFALAGTASYEIYLIHTLLIFMIKDRLSFTNVVLYVFVCGVVVTLFYWGNWRMGRVGKGHTLNV